MARPPKRLPLDEDDCAPLRAALFALFDAQAAAARAAFAHLPSHDREARQVHRRAQWARRASRAALDAMASDDAGVRRAALEVLQLAEPLLSSEAINTFCRPRRDDEAARREAAALARLGRAISPNGLTLTQFLALPPEEQVRLIRQDQGPFGARRTDEG